MSKYVDTTSIMQVIGCVYNTPQLLDYSDKYTITDYDFPNEFHRIVFGSIYKLHELGAEVITIENIVDFLSSRPTSEAIFHKENGEEWLSKVSQAASISTFDYYYGRLKKMSLLRAYAEQVGLDVTDIYDPDNIMDVKKRQLQEDYLDNASLLDIVNKIDEKIDRIKTVFANNANTEAQQAGEGVVDLIERLEQFPEAGLPLYGKYINTITRGARLKKFYLRSAPTGIGKTRSMIADACYIGCSSMYIDGQGWVSTGVAAPVVFITTEQEIEEVQTMMLAFLSNVNEEHILKGQWEGDERERVIHAGEIMENSPFYIQMLPDFSLQDVEDCIRRNIRDHEVAYVFNPKRVWDCVILFHLINGVIN